jgi:DNA-binding response OmpR family regulator
VIGATSGQTDRRGVCRPGHSHDASPIEHLRTRLRRLERQLARLERLCGTALEDLVLLEDDLAAADARDDRASWLPSLRRRRPLVTGPKVVASAINTGSGRVTIVVAGVAQEVALTALHLELVAFLAAPTRQSPDHLVGFKTLGNIVHALRRRYGRVSRRSVTVAISRLRQALGPSNGGLVETARGAGYRVRVMAGQPPSVRADR